MRDFSDLTEREILALAIANEEEDSRIYLDIAEGLREEYPGSAHVFSEMAGRGRRTSSSAAGIIPEQIRRTHPADPPARHSRLYPPQAGLADPAAQSEGGSHAGGKHGGGDPTSSTARPPSAPTDVSIRKLLGDLADAEVEHERRADGLRRGKPDRGRGGARGRSRACLLRAAGDPTRSRRPDGWFRLHPGTGFRNGVRLRQHLGDVSGGMAASIGAGISMGFAEALSDNGSLTGRGAPLDTRVGTAA